MYDVSGGGKVNYCFFHSFYLAAANLIFHLKIYDYSKFQSQLFVQIIKLQSHANLDA